MKGRTNEEGIDPVEDGSADDARRRGEAECRHGGKHGAPRERTMIEEILDPENLARAWQRVKANKGAPGIDGTTIAEFPAFAREHWPRIAIAIREGTYRPAPVRRAWIPKPDGSKRPLGIPTVTLVPVGDALGVVNMQRINEIVFWHRIVTGVEVASLTIVLEYDPACLVG